jgi:hypothetical protein
MRNLHDKVKDTDNCMWLPTAKRLEHFVYSSENDIAKAVKSHLESFLEPLGINVHICIETEIQGIRHDMEYNAASS